MEPLDVVTTTYLACLVDVVGAYTGADPVARPLTAASPIAGTTDDTCATLVRFGEERVWGSSLLVADEATLRDLAAGEVDDLFDWLGELNNQLVGRMKNRLIRWTPHLQISMPVPVVGFVKGRGATAGWEVVWDGGRLTACLGVTVTPGVTLAADEPATAAAAEGSLVLF